MDKTTYYLHFWLQKVLLSLTFTQYLSVCALLCLRNAKLRCMKQALSFGRRRRKSSAHDAPRTRTLLAEPPWKPRRPHLMSRGGPAGDVTSRRTGHVTFQPRPGALYERSRATLPVRSRDSHIRGAVVSFCWFVMHVRTRTLGCALLYSDADKGGRRRRVNRI